MDQSILMVARLWLIAMCVVVAGTAQAAWVDTDLDNPADAAAQRSPRGYVGPASSIDLLVNLQTPNNGVIPSGFSTRGAYTNSVWPGSGRGHLVEPFVAAAPFAPTPSGASGIAAGGAFAAGSGSGSVFGLALGSQSAHGAGLFGSGAIPAASTWAQNFRLGVEPTALYGGATAAPAVDERAVVRRVNVPVHYESAPGSVEVFVRWMQENRIVIIAAGLLLLLLLGLGSMAAGARS